MGLPSWRTDRRKTSERGYGWRWQQEREVFLRAHPLCEMCAQEQPPRTTAATVVDHRIPHRGDERLFWDRSNWQAICKPHHDGTKQAIEKGSERVGLDGFPVAARPLSQEASDRRFPSDLQPSAIPVVMVCGPPGAGKSTYVKAHAGPADLVIDLDRIIEQVSGLPLYHRQGNTPWIAQALDRRNTLLRSLATDTQHPRAWFVISAPDPAERQRWADTLGARVVLLDTPLPECERRIKADPARHGCRQRMLDEARRWWQTQGAGKGA